MGHEKTWSEFLDDVFAMGITADKKDLLLEAEEKRRAAPCFLPILSEIHGHTGRVVISRTADRVAREIDKLNRMTWFKVGPITDLRLTASRKGVTIHAVMADTKINISREFALQGVDALEWARANLVRCA